LLASTSTICDADLNSHEITLPTTPGIAVAALLARDLDKKLSFLGLSLIDK